MYAIEVHQRVKRERVERERRVTKKCVSIYIEREREEEWGERAKDRLERVV